MTSPSAAADATPYHLSDRYTRDEGRVFLTGVQALARLPIEQLRADRRAGPRTASFVSGYPLGGYDEEIARAKASRPCARSGDPVRPELSVLRTCS